MTLEERVKKYASQYLHPILYEEAKKFYRKLALEQREYDIDKAWNYFKDIVYSWCLETGQDTDKVMPIEKAKFYKAMEE